MGNLDRQKILMIFGGALVAAFLMSWLVYAAQAPKAAKLTKVTAAIRDMGAGTRLKQSDLKLVSVSDGDVPKYSIADPKLAIDRVLLFPVTVNEPLTLAKISTHGGAEGIPATIEMGKRAISVQITDQSGAGGLVQPRSRVDVLFTRTGSMNEAVTTVILENIVVLSVGRLTEAAVTGAPGAPTPPSSTATRAATLLLTPEQAAKLEFARQQGKISLALRNPLDTSTSSEEDTPPVITAQDLNIDAGPRIRRRQAGAAPNLRNDEVWRRLTSGDPSLANPAAPVKPVAEKKEPPKPKSVVDVYRGDKHVQEIFQ